MEATTIRPDWPSRGLHMKIHTGPALLTLSFLLSGCGGGDGTASNTELACRNDYGNGQVLTTDPRLRAASSDADLVGSVQSYLTSINCVSSASLGRGQPEFVGAPAAPVGAAPGGTTGADSTAPPSSETNTQERGVDEADLVESDGEFLFVAKSTNYYPIGIGQPVLPVVGVSDGRSSPSVDSPIVQNELTVRILRLTTAPAAATEVSILRFTDADAINGLYLRRTPGGQRQLNILLHAGLDTVVRSFDVTDPAKPSLNWEWKSQGYLLSSRRIDNRLYLINNYAPFAGSPIQPLPFEVLPTVSDKITTNAATITQLTAATITPTAQFNGEQRPTINANDCYVPVAGDPIQRLYPYPTVVYGLRVDLDNPATISSFCTLDSTGDFYASTNALYLLRHDLDGSVVHKVAFVPEGFKYIGSALVPGMVMRSNSFQLSEHNGDLRIVTTEVGTTVIAENDIAIGIAIRPGELQHRLFVLRENTAADGFLQTVAALPNTKHPEPIGKPNESLFAVRFAGPRAYLVTFLRTDPFYVVDLSDPADPFLAGELELPGFSEYLHPFGTGLVLGVGHEATDTGQTLGVKVGLFDVSDPATPKVVGSQIIGKRGTSTAVSYDYHAFTVLENVTPGTHRVALPVEVNETPSGFDPNYFNWTYTGLFLFEVSDTTTQPAASLTPTGTLIAQRATDPDPVGLFGTRRSVLVGDDVHFVTDDKVWSAPWSDPANRLGPQ